MFAGFKQIAQALSEVWKRDVSIDSVKRYAQWDIDPLPLHRMRRPGASRGPVYADPDLIAEWASRHCPP